METRVFFDGKYRVEKGVGTSKRSGKPYEIYFIVLETPVGEQRFAVDRRTEMGIVVSTICKMC